MKEKGKPGIRVWDPEGPDDGAKEEKRVPDAVKAANAALTVEETAELEKAAGSLELNVIRFREKEMKEIWKY